MFGRLFGDKTLQQPSAPSRVDPEASLSVTWGPLELSNEEAVQHFAAIGSTGSGKTTILQLLMQRALPRIGVVPDHRAIIKDAKGDVLPLLHSVAPNVTAVTLNPFDARSVAWAMGQDINEARLCLECATTLVPREPESQPFFSDSTRHLLYCVMLSYLTRGIDWTLADLIRPFASPRLLRNVLSASVYTSTAVTRYFGDKRALSNILATAATKLLPFEVVAACWEKAPQRISMRDWVNGSYILVLGNSEISRFAMDSLNRCIFKRASDLSLDLPNSNSRRSWFFLDEATEGKLDGLVSLAKKGRSKGCCIVLAFQSISGLKDPSLYGPAGAAEILGQIGHRFLGRLEDSESAEYASKLIGDQESRLTTVSRTFAHENSVSHNEHITIRPAVLASELLSIPPCGLRNGLTGFYLSRCIPGVFQACMPGEFLFHHSLKKPSTVVPEFIPRPAEDQLLLPWSPEQEKLFAPTPATSARKRKPVSITRDSYRDL